ncbi:MAG: hypothetical protein E6I62_08330 [Chloroflexi bacterium]|nr:MAG: hypothetical protein E6I62_08330 [Chloroflexota bacterium]
MTARPHATSAAPRPPAHARAAATVLLAMLLAACAGGGATPSGDIAHPAGGALVLRMATAGGFIEPQTGFSQVPSVSVFGDGRVIVPGAVDLIYPGPALPPLLVRRLSEPGLQAVLHDVLATGLFATSRDFNGAGIGIADAGTTTFSLHADGRDVTVSVYALGTVDLSNPPPGVSQDELAAHRALTRLSGRLSSLDSWLPAGSWMDAAWQPFAPEAVRLLVRTADADAPDQSGIANQLVPWPTADDPATFGDVAAQPEGARCGVVTAADAATWLRALMRANQLTRFTAAAHRYQVTPRPLLPDEPRSCPIT